MPEDALDTLVAAPAVADTVATETVASDAQDSQVNDAPVIESTSTPRAAGDETQDTETPVAQDAPAQPPAEEHVPVSRYKELQAEFTRRTQAEKQIERELAEAREKLSKYQGLDPKVISDYEATRAKPVWHPTSPNYARFSAAQERLKVISSLTEISQEQKQALASQHLSEEELGWVTNWGRHQRDEQRRMTEDPQGYIQNLIKDQLESTVEQRLSGYATKQQTDAVVQATFMSQEFRSLYLTPDGRAKTENGVRLERLMGEQQLPFEVADRIVRAEAKAARLEAETLELRRRATSAGERERLLKDGATEIREVRTGGGDIDQEAQRIAKQRGIPLASPAYLDLLIQLSSKK